MSLIAFLLLLGVLRTLMYVWHNGDLFAETRAVLNAAVNEDIDDGRGLLGWVYRATQLLYRAVLCPFCSVHHVGAILAIGPTAYYGVDWTWPVRCIAYGWSAAEVLWIIDHFLPDEIRFSKKDLQL